MANHRAKTTKPLAASTNAQPPPVMMPFSTVFATALRLAVPNTPQAMNARTMAAATPKTVRSRTGGPSSSYGVMSSIGSVSGAAPSPAVPFPAVPADAPSTAEVRSGGSSGSGREAVDASSV